MVIALSFTMLHWPLTAFHSAGKDTRYRRYVNEWELSTQGAKYDDLIESMTEKAMT